MEFLKTIQKKINAWFRPGHIDFNSLETFYVFCVENAKYPLLISALKELIAKHPKGLVRGKGMFLYGQLYLHGSGVPADAQEANLWFRQSAVQGFALGQVALGASLLADKRPDEAMFWICTAAKQGEPAAIGQMFFLGYKYPDYLNKHICFEEQERLYKDFSSENIKEVSMVRNLLVNACLLEGQLCMPIRHRQLSSFVLGRLLEARFHETN